jgi:hypothetical protein
MTSFILCLGNQISLADDEKGQDEDKGVYQVTE